jgi:RNA polymerase sigma-70 factor, ECF subfamily
VEANPAWFKRLTLAGRHAASYTTPDAFSQLYERTHRSVYRYVYGLVGSAHDAEDVTAATYLKAWNARERFAGDEDAALGWMCTIARRLAIDAARRRQTRPGDVELTESMIAAPDASPEEQAALLDQTRRLWTLVQALPDDAREMITLRYLLGWRVNRIAEHLGIKENTVSVTLKRLLAQLRTALNEE